MLRVATASLEGACATAIKEMVDKQFAVVARPVMQKLEQDDQHPGQLCFLIGVTNRMLSRNGPLVPARSC